MRTAIVMVTVIALLRSASPAGEPVSRAIVEQSSTIVVGRISAKPVWLVDRAGFEDMKRSRELPNTNKFLIGRVYQLEVLRVLKDREDINATSLLVVVHGENSLNGENVPLGKGQLGVLFLRHFESPPATELALYDPDKLELKATTPVTSKDLFCVVSPEGVLIVTSTNDQQVKRLSAFIKNVVKQP